MNPDALKKSTRMRDRWSMTMSVKMSPAGASMAHVATPLMAQSQQTNRSKSGAPRATSLVDSLAR